jgi:SOS-response transcriptional repressor LexA
MDTHARREHDGVDRETGVGARLHPGAVDDVIVRAQPWIEHGDVCGVVTDQEVAVKTIWHRRTGLWLKPESVQQWYPPIRLRLQQHVFIMCQVIGMAI